MVRGRSAAARGKRYLSSRATPASRHSPCHHRGDAAGGSGDQAELLEVILGMQQVHGLVLRGLVAHAADKRIVPQTGEQIDLLGDTARKSPAARTLATLPSEAMIAPCLPGKGSGSLKGRQANCITGEESR